MNVNIYMFYKYMSKYNKYYQSENIEIFGDFSLHLV